MALWFILNILTHVIADEKEVPILREEKANLPIFPF